MKEKANQTIIEKDISAMLVQEIADIEIQSFSEDLRCPEHEIRENLGHDDAITIISYDENGRVGGYLLACDFLEEYKDLKKDADPDIEYIPGALHIWSIAIRPDLIGKGYFGKLVKKILEAHPDKSITLHANAANSCSAGMQKYGAKFIRRIDSWYGIGEPYDYLIFEPKTPSVIRESI